jgi:hypothetical protein
MKLFYPILSGYFYAHDVRFARLNSGIMLPGGLNFEATLRRRRHSFKPDDRFLAFIAGRDTCARALKTAHALRESGRREMLARIKKWSVPFWNIPLPTAPLKTVQITPNVTYVTDLLINTGVYYI